MVAPAKQEMTVEEFDALLALPENADRLLELVNGEIVEKMPTQEHGYILLRLGSRLIYFLDAHQLGVVYIDSTHHVPGDPRNKRRPDIAYMSFARSQTLVKKGAIPQIPDLAVEIQSPDDSVDMMREKAAYYLGNGSRMVWLIYPEKRIVEVYQAGKTIELLVPGDTLNGGDVLPGFTLAVSDIFAQVTPPAAE